jgi:hypothetical protein
MGGSGFVGALASSNPKWCTGDDVVKALNDVFDSDPTDPNGLYQAAKAASLDLFLAAWNSGHWQDLLAAYVAAFDPAPICAGWAFYLKSLGTLSGNVGNIVTTSPTDTNILTFGANNVPDWMANGLNVSDSSGAITGGQTTPRSKRATPSSSPSRQD